MVVRGRYVPEKGEVLTFRRVRLVLSVGEGYVVTYGKRSRLQTSGKSSGVGIGVNPDRAEAVAKAALEMRLHIRG